MSKSRSRSPRSKASKSKSSPGSNGFEEDSFAMSKSRSRSESRSISPTSRASRNQNSSPEKKNGDDWNPDNFVATIDPFTKAKPSNDPFNDPFYPPASNEDEPKKMYSFVYSEDDAELERGGFSKDTMTGLSFDSADGGDVNNQDGISYKTESDTTEIIQNNEVANQLRNSRKQLIPPNEKSDSVRSSFLGIDDSGAVTLNVGSPRGAQNKGKIKGRSPTVGSLTQKARTKKSRGFLDDDFYDEPGRIGNKRPSPKNSQRESPRNIYEARSTSTSPQNNAIRSPSYILDRRNKRKSIQKEKERKTSMQAKERYSIVRGESDPIVAQERGRRREQILSPQSKGGSGRTFSPDKMRFALRTDRSNSPTKELSRTRIRSPQRDVEREPKVIEEDESWFERPQFSTLHLKSPPSSRKSKSSSTRSAFKAPQVFFGSPREAAFKAHEVYDRRTDPVLASVSHIEDPIQRAGAMILSAAAIPIQAEMRKYLAIKHREDRTWSIVVLQAYFRRWKAELTRYKYLYCVTRIQAAFRGWLVRDTLKDKHYCATQIQKIGRGYLATMSVYEDLYNITVIQSIARRHIAMRAAEERYCSICKIQALWRGLQCRRELSYLHWSAIKVQSAWRGYTAKLNYQFDIVDIIICQSVIRRKHAFNLANSLRTEKEYTAATTIQRYWRSYDCTMNYLHSVADILIAQSVVRRWIAQRYVKEYRVTLHYEMAMRIQMCMRAWLSRTRVKKQRAARDIQKVWRGFWSYTDYVFTLSDIITVQKVVRGHMARKKTKMMAAERNVKRRYDSAVMIQKTWRGCSAQMEMLFNLVNIIIVQVSLMLSVHHSTILTKIDV